MCRAKSAKRKDHNATDSRHAKIGTRYNGKPNSGENYVALEHHMCIYVGARDIRRSKMGAISGTVYSNLGGSLFTPYRDKCSIAGLRILLVSVILQLSNLYKLC